MAERNMIVRDIVEEVDVFLVEHERCSDGMHRSVTPSFVEEATILIEFLEEIKIRL